VGGTGTGWTVQPAGYTGDTPEGDTLLRPAPSYVRVATPTKKGSGLIYAWDQQNARVVAFDKAKGTFVEQYRLTGGSTAWTDVRGMYVVAGAGPDAPATLVWATKDTVYSALLVATPTSSGTAGSGSAAPAGAGGSSRPSGAPASASTKP
jgi:hypothetical protein